LAVTQPRKTPFGLSVDLKKCMVNVQNDAYIVASSIIEVLYKQLDHEILKKQVDEKRQEFGVRCTLSSLTRAVSINLLSCDPGDKSGDYL